MATTYQAGRRIQGTSTDFGTDGAGIPAISGGWKELGRHVIGTASSEVFVASLPDKRYYMVLYEDKGEASANARLLRYNSDSGSNYSNRVSSNGAADTTSTSQPQHNGWNNNNTLPQFNVWYIANLAGKEKMLLSQGVYQDTAGAGTTPDRVEYVGKWANTADAINRIGVIQNAGTHSTGTTMTVLGWDPTDTHTTNFWEELASVTLGSANDLIDSGTITAKKYLWIQIYNTAKPSGGNSYVYYNDVTSGGTHSGRSNTNGANPTNQSSQSDYQLTSTNGSIINHDVSSSGTTTGMFTNIFVINNASNAKLSIIHSVSGWTNAGAGVAPARFECVGKWTNTSAQITSVQAGGVGTSNYMGAGSTIKVWGSN